MHETSPTKKFRASMHLESEGGGKRGCSLPFRVVFLENQCCLARFGGQCVSLRAWPSVNGGVSPLGPELLLSTSPVCAWKAGSQLGRTFESVRTLLLWTRSCIGGKAPASRNLVNHPPALREPLWFHRRKAQALMRSAIMMLLVAAPSAGSTLAKG
jgi:hypothetical protein